MVDLLQYIGDRVVAVILATTAAISGFVSVIQTTILPQEKTALVYETVVVPHAENPFFAGISSTPQTTSTTIPTSTANSSSIAAILPPETTTTVKIKIAPSVQKTSTTKIPVVATPAITSQWFLDNTKFSLKQRLGGGYKVIFSASSGAENLTWGASDASIGGSAMPLKFAFSFSCNPLLEVPPFDSFDQTPFFKVRVSYDCTMGFAATSGSDQRILSKNLPVETGPGQLVISPPSAMNTVLADETNDGGFVLKNEDAKPATVTNLTLDVSYTALNTQIGPLVLQILDPSTDVSLFKYHMENLAADTSLPYTHSATGIEVPLSFTLKPADRKLLPVRILGVHRMMISGVDPTVTVALRALAVDPSDIKPTLNTAQIRWSCVVPLTGYDPNATSGPFAAGDACR